MNIVKFIRKQGKTKEADPKIFEETIECDFPGVFPKSAIIPISGIKSELLKCSFKAEEPEKFLAIGDGKAKKVSIDCFDIVKIYIPEGYELKSINFKDIEKIKVTPDNVKEFAYVEKELVDSSGAFYTIFFGDFLKMIMHSQYNKMNVKEAFYNRLGDIPVIVDSENMPTDIFNTSDFANPTDPYISLTTEKGDIYFIHVGL